MNKIILPIAMVVILLISIATLYAQGEADNSTSLTRLGIMKVRGGDYEGGIKLLDKAINMDKENTLAYFQRGRARLAIGNYKEAIEDFDITIRQQPDYAPAYVERANVKSEMKDNAGAKQDMDTAVKLDPSYLKQPEEVKIAKEPEKPPELQKPAEPEKKEEGNISKTPEKPEKKEGDEIVKAPAKPAEPEKKGEDLSQKAKVLNLNDQLAKVGELSKKDLVVEKYFQQGKAKLLNAINNRSSDVKNAPIYNDAIWYFNKALEIAPKNAEAYYYRGLAYNHLGNYGDAIANYDRAIKLNPKFAIALNRRGVFKSTTLDDEQGALADLNKAIESNPEYAEAYSNRGSIKRSLKDYKGAIADWEKAIKLEPWRKGELQAYIDAAKKKMK